jgi:hypothetical protein
MITDPVRASRSEHKASADRQYYLMSGGKFLNQSGEFLQDGRKYAWQGTIDQARNCRARYGAAAGCRAVPIHATIPTALAVEA